MTDEQPNAAPRVSAEGIRGIPESKDSPAGAAPDAQEWVKHLRSYNLYDAADFVNRQAAEIAALRKDADRYRQARAGVPGHTFMGGFLDAVDERAIDAALARGSPRRISARAWARAAT